eukprot:m.235105 g.235105  ORF g.235105 m.235105 type:complete len:219 (-) comp19910_c0_seq1:30-686(-)
MASADKRQVKRKREDGPNLADLPRAGREIVAILTDMGVTKFDPRVISQLLEFYYRYVHDVLDDAQRFAEHRTSNAEAPLNKDDLRLAVSTRVECSYSAPPPRELLLEIASKKNAVPLPAIPDKPGVRLPPERECLTNPNYVVLPSRAAPAAREGGPWDIPASDATLVARKAAEQAKLKRRQRRAMAAAATVVPVPLAAPAEMVMPTQSKAAAAADDYD